MQVVIVRYVNDHFHDNCLVYSLFGKSYFTLDELAIALGEEYRDFDCDGWKNICFVLDKGEQKVNGYYQNVHLPIGFGLQSLFHYLEGED